MGAELNIHPGRQIASEAAFLASYPPYSIAVEAVVAAPPRFVRLPRGPYLNIDHHEGVERPATAAACLQAWNAAGRGLVDAFRDPEGVYQPTVVVRDCDQDVTLAWDVLRRAADLPDLPDEHTDRLSELVHAESTLDVFGGIPPGRITPRVRRIMERIAWIFDAYTSCRASGELYVGDPETYRAVISEGSRRISEHIAGEGHSRELDTRYKVLVQAAGCVLIRRLGAEGLLGAHSQGHNAVITWQPRPNGYHQYTYSRRSEFVPFNLRYLYAKLNEEEHCVPGTGHGGSTDIGGSPLATGSAIDPERLMQLIAEDPRVMSYD